MNKFIEYFPKKSVFIKSMIPNIPFYTDKILIVKVYKIVINCDILFYN